MAKKNDDQDRDDQSRTGRGIRPGPGLTDEADSGRGVAGGALGGTAGALGGGAIGSFAGPVGTIIGAVAGAAGGWWSGKEVAESTFDFSDADDDFYRQSYERASSTTGTSGGGSASRRRSYDEVRPLYQFGQFATRNPEYRGRRFEEIEPELRRGWTSDLERQYGDWSTVRGYLNEGYTRADESRITRSEEELAIGKRQVEAGEVAVRKTVETERVTERVPVMREEVTVERRPVAAADTASTEIGEDRIVVPVTEEEVVVEKRPVVKEEVVLRTRAVEDTEEVEADLRRERIEVDERGRTHGSRGAADTTGERGLDDSSAR